MMELDRTYWLRRQSHLARHCWRPAGRLRYLAAPSYSGEPRDSDYVVKDAAAVLVEQVGTNLEVDHEWERSRSSWPEL